MRGLNRGHLLNIAIVVAVIVLMAGRSAPAMGLIIAQPQSVASVVDDNGLNEQAEAAHVPPVESENQRVVSTAVSPTRAHDNTGRQILTVFGSIALVLLLMAFVPKKWVAYVKRKNDEANQPGWKHPINRWMEERENRRNQRSDRKE